MSQIILLIYKEESQKKIDEVMQLILDRGVLPDGANELPAVVTVMDSRI
eukprot:SAG22_NODE_137_length_18056_cov_9.974940_1_plen_49_part_00